MKTKLISTLLAVAMVFSTTSCSNETDDILYQGEYNVESFGKLKGDLLALNSTYEKKNPQDTRFKFKKWFRFLVCSVSDVGGLILSGFKMDSSISSSKEANKLLNDIEDGVNRTPTKKTVKDTALAGLVSGSAGYIHNMAIVNMYNQYGEAMDTISTERLVDITAKEVYSLTNDPLLCSPKEEAVTLTKNIVAKLDVTKSVTENMNALKTLTNDAQTKSELDICCVLLEGLQMVDDCDTTYVITADKLINDSDLPISEKNKIKEGLSVGFASAKLWNTTTYEPVD